MKHTVLLLTTLAVSLLLLVGLTGHGSDASAKEPTATVTPSRVWPTPEPTARPTESKLERRPSNQSRNSSAGGEPPWAPTVRCCCPCWCCCFPLGLLGGAAIVLTRKKWRGQIVRQLAKLRKLLAAPVPPTPTP